MLKKTIRSVVLISMLITFTSFSQELMDLEECLRQGLEYNYDLHSVRNEEQISDNNVTLGNAEFLHSVTLNSGYSVRSSNSDQFLAGGDVAQQQRNAATGTLDAGVNLNWTLFEGFRVQTSYQRLKELQSVGEL